MTDWPTFTVSYRYEGETWCMSLTAKDWEDATRRLQAIAGGTVDGVIVETGALCDECGEIAAAGAERVEPARAH